MGCWILDKLTSVEPRTETPNQAQLLNQLQLAANKAELVQYVLA